MYKVVISSINEMEWYFENATEVAFNDITDMFELTFDDGTVSWYPRESITAVSFCKIEEPLLKVVGEEEGEDDGDMGEREAESVDIE